MTLWKWIAVVIALLVTGVAVPLVFVNLGGSSSPTGHGTPAPVSLAGKPRWVAESARLLQRKFVGQPRIVSLSYRERKNTRSVSVGFDRVAICGGCSAPTNASLPRGNRAWLRLDARTGGVAAFGLRIVEAQA